MKYKIVYQEQYNKEIKSPITRIIIYNMSDVKKFCISLLKANTEFYCFPDHDRATIDIFDIIDNYDIETIMKGE